MPFMTCIYAIFCTCVCLATLQNVGACHDAAILLESDLNVIEPVAFLQLSAAISPLSTKTSLASGRNVGGVVNLTAIVNQTHIAETTRNLLQATPRYQINPANFFGRRYGLASGSWNITPFAMGFASMLFVIFALILWQMSFSLSSLVDLRRQHNAQAALLLNDPPEGSNATAYSVRSTAGPAFYVVLYVLCSAALTEQNKWLMARERFPFAVNLTLGHQVSGTLFLLVLYSARPSMFPSFSNAGQYSSIEWKTVVRSLAPIVVCFSGQLVLSNVALHYSSVTFLQMMKEGSLVIVFGISLMVGLDYFQCVRSQMVLGLILATTLALHEEIDFSRAGFMFQGAGQIIEAAKVILQSMLLCTAGTRNLDPYTYNLLVQPASAFLIGVLLCGCLAFPGAPTADWAAYVALWPYLLANCSLALVMNIVATVFIANTSAVGFIAAGVFKDAFLVAVDVAFLGTSITGVQIGAFALQLFFVAGYSLLKAFPKLLQQENEEKCYV